MNFDIKNYDFIDFGCSYGDSIRYGIDNFGGKCGVGIDIDPQKVELARKNGYDAILGDITKISKSPEFKKSVKFVSMIHFLEHLAGFKQAEECIHSAVSIARDFIFIRQPFFDSDIQLYNKGFKFFWSDWVGHPFHMTSFDFHRILMPLQRHSKISSFIMFGNIPIVNSNDPTIHPLNSKIDQHEYDLKKHPPKNNNVNFNNVFRELEVFINLRNKNIVNYHMEKLHGKRKVLFDSKPFK